MIAPRGRLQGVIASSGFASGDRVVIGHWRSSPIGPLSDVMWAAPDGRRTLFVGAARAADYITSIYDFDAVEVGELSVVGDDRSLEARVGDRWVRLTGGRRIPVLPVPRPRWFTTAFEAPLARAILGVEAVGTSPRGVREWYQARWVRRVVEAEARIGGRDLGAFGDVWPPVGVGFSEPPRFPSLVRVDTRVVTAP